MSLQSLPWEEMGPPSHEGCRLLTGQWGGGDGTPNSSEAESGPGDTISPGGWDVHMSSS